jgi:hypothetical protein
MADLTLRQTKGSALTIAEMDGNFEYFTGSYTNTGTITAVGFIGDVTGSVTGSVNGNADTSTTSSFALTASYTETAQTASYVAAADIDGTVSNAVTASFVSSLLTIASSDPLPSQADGAIAFSSSGDFYFGSGSAWNKLTL